MKRLIEEVIKGNDQAVSTFYTTFSPRILRYLLQKLPPDDANDILHIVFLEAIDSISLLKNENNLQAWLYRLARNKVADFYRKKKLKSVVLSQLPFLEIVDSKINEPEFILEKNKIRDQIEAALYAISEKYRYILLLHYEEGRAIKEIAVILNLSEKATESLLFRARQSFKIAYARA